MKQYLLAGVMVMALALTVAGTASAEEATSSLSKIQEARQEYRDSQMNTREDLAEQRAGVIDANREAVEGIRSDDSLTPEARREALKAQWENRKSSFTDIRQARMAAFADRVAHRLEMAILRVERLADRLEARLEILKDKGADTEASAGLIAEARTAINEAKVALADFQSKVTDLTASETPKELVAGVREASKTTIEKIRAAHAKVVDAIKAVKGASTADKAENGNSDDDSADE